MKPPILMLNGMKMKTNKFMTSMRYKCQVCNYIYDLGDGDPHQGIKPGTPFEELPENWECPVCGAPKSNFDEIDF
jgi:rubredoxin